MCKPVAFALALVFFLAGPSLIARADHSATVVFNEAGFPSSDSAAPGARLSAALSGAQLADAEHLRDALAAPATRLPPSQKMHGPPSSSFLTAEAISS